MILDLFRLLITLLCFVEALSFHLILKVPFETVCSLSCHVSPKCLSYFYKHVKDDGNCILKSNIGKSPSDRLFHHYFGARIGAKMVIYHHASSPNIEEEAFNAGFNNWIIVNGKKSFFLHVFQPTNFRDAIINCFFKGGILPMEQTDEFIDAMSILSNDSVTPRFTSLAREFTKANGVRHLTWNLGPKEWGEDENGTANPKFQEWPKTNFDDYLFQIDPTRKKYIPSSIEDTKDSHCCQFLGKNLATHKPVTSSSGLGTFSSDKAVDGLLGWNFWHAKLHSNYNKPDWISVDLGMTYVIKVVMWLGRPQCCTERNKDVQVWTGQEYLATGSYWKDVNLHTMKYCGIHPYSTPNSILSGVTCQEATIGQYVVLVNHGARYSTLPMQIGEIGIFGTLHE